MEWRNYRPDDLIFREGEASDAAYLIVSGSVRIVKGYGTDKPKELAVVGAGEYVGEMGAIDNLPRSASAVAQGTVVCAPVTPAEFMDMLRKNPDEAIDLLKILFERLRAANRRLAEIEQAGAS
ncbi:MAG: cyclic nucleotide-binding domain-containing protein [Kiloniellales bacterium]|nr:cyclic nucleotide-binding domain-containing protein [Kiloniellales bacterium]